MTPSSRSRTRRPSWLMSSTTPSATRKSASLARLQVENGRLCSAGLDLAIFLISRRWPRVNFGGWPRLYFGQSDPNPSALKFRITSRTRSSLVNATLAIAGTSMPWADSSTIWARRQVTTDPLPRRMIRTSRRPASSSISRTRSRSVTEPVSEITACGESPSRANVACYGTRSLFRRQVKRPSTEMLAGTCRPGESSRCRPRGRTGTLAAIPSPATVARRGGRIAQR